MKLTKSFKLDDWATSLAKENNIIYCSSADGSISVFDQIKSSQLGSNKVHASNIAKITMAPSSISPNTLLSCSNDSTVKIYDTRQKLEPVHSLENSRRLPFFSLDISNTGLIASGSELKQQDVELTLWDIRKCENSLRSLIDGHNDDITECKFHPLKSNLLLSGSTDGCVNIYDLNITDEDEALYQSINHNSVHSANFLNENRIFVLSHMETLSLFDVSKESDLDPDTAKKDDKFSEKELGDVREKWDCNYVIDIKAPNYVVMGSYQSQLIKIAQFSGEFDSLDNVTELKGAHGEEVVRDLTISDGIVWSAGEDCCVKVWENDLQEPKLNDTRKNFIVSSEPLIEQPHEEAMDVEFKTKENLKKEKHSRKSKHSKKNKRKNKFNPY